jgi:hypothetical protein
VQKVTPEQVVLATRAKLRGILARNEIRRPAMEAEAERRRRAKRAHRAARKRAKLARKRNRR